MHASETGLTQRHLQQPPHSADSTAPDVQNMPAQTACPAASEQPRTAGLDSLSESFDRALAHYCNKDMEIPSDNETFMGHRVLGLDDQGLPVIQETGEERRAAIRELTAMARERGQDSHDLEFLVVPEPQYANGAGPKTGTFLRTAVLMDSPALQACRKRAV